MKWTLLGFLGLGCILTFASASGVRSLGQPPKGTGPNRPSSPNVPAYDQSPYYSTNPGARDYPGQPEGRYQVARPLTHMGPDGKPVTTMEFVNVNGAPPNEEGRQALREAQAKLRAPDASESDKKESRTSIEKFLEDEFERDQKMRREQVTRLEEQVSKLRKQLDKREQSKSKIIELRMQLMENDAEGLSFPESFNELQRFDVPNGTGLTLGPPSAYGPNGSFVPYSPGPLYRPGPIPNQPIPPNGVRPTELGRAN